MESDPLTVCLRKILQLKFPLAPIVAVKAKLVAEELDPLLDELRLQLIAPSA